MKVAIILCCVVLACLSAFGQDVQDQCGSHPNLLRDATGNLKWLSPEEVQTRATTTVYPEAMPMPGGTRYTGVVGAKILVNTSGEVVCLWGASGHPVAIPAAMRALHEWKFKPMTSAGKPVEFLAHVKVPVRSTTAKN